MIIFLKGTASLGSTLKRFLTCRKGKNSCHGFHNNICIMEGTNTVLQIRLNIDETMLVILPVQDLLLKESNEMIFTRISPIILVGFPW